MRLLVPFSDDSTLFFARKLRDLCKQHAPDIAVDLAAYIPELDLSERQIDDLLPSGPDLILDGPALSRMASQNGYTAIVTSRIYRRLNDLLHIPTYRKYRHRPVIIGFLGGLEFFPHNAIANRQACDAVFVTPQDFPFDENIGLDCPARPGQIAFGHPHFLLGQKRLELGNNIYFFAQAISPKTRRSRMHIVETLAAMARRYRDRDVVVKLRHSEQENQAHLHIERHDYASLIDTLGPNRPDNLRTRVCTMGEAILDAGYGITCTSTAVFDLIAHQLPIAIYLDYLDYSLDPLNGPMRDYFAQSALIQPLSGVLNLEWTACDVSWRERFMQSETTFIACLRQVIVDAILGLQKSHTR